MIEASRPREAEKVSGRAPAALGRLLIQGVGFSSMTGQLPA